MHAASLREFSVGLIYASTAMISFCTHVTSQWRWLCMHAWTECPKGYTER